jgi:protein-S-isoprenylcysteine O-methyltransferase Ste14
MSQTKKDFRNVFLNTIAGLIVALILAFINYFLQNPESNFGWLVNDPLQFFKKIYFQFSIPMRLNMFIWGMTFFIYYILDKYDSQIDIDKKREVHEETFKNKLFVAYSFFTVTGLIYINPISYENEFFTIGSNVLGVIFTAVGFIILILSRVEIDGLWGPHIYTYKDEKLKKIVTSGMYKYMRHPIYFGQGMLAISTFVLSQSLWFGLFSLFVIFSNAVRAHQEEKALTKIYPKKYKEYKESVKSWWLF